MHARTVFITGASSGLGAHFASVLLDEGYNVVLAARRLDRLRDVAATFADREDRVLVVKTDVTDEQSVKRAFDQAESRFGVVHAAIANAGMNSAGTALDLEVEEFDRLMNVNVRGAFLTAREAARRMSASDTPDHKAIVLVASIGGLHPLPGLVAYSASKAAVVMLARGLACELSRRNIAVNALCPGFIETELNQAWFSSPPGMRQIQSFPRRRLMQASFLDRMVAFLAGPDSRGVTGSVFKLDDGQTP